MEPSGGLHSLPPKKNFKPRDGQAGFSQEYFKSATPRKVFCGQYPTGYGKTVIAALAFEGLYRRGLVNRMLLIVASTQQLNQAKDGFASDCKMVGLGGVQCKPFENTGAMALSSQRGDANVFIATVQAVAAAYRGANSQSKSGSTNCLAELLSKGDWLVIADEYHHYGDGRDWGNAVKEVVAKSKFSIGLSATPFNRQVPTIFGAPDFVWTYKQALKEGAVKSFELKTAKYAITLVGNDNCPEDLTTCELREATSDPDKMIKQKALRYSDKYVQPILRRAIHSLIKKRAETGQKLQLLVRAHGCHHAQLLAKTLAEVTDLETDWIGSGEYGRRDFENEAILRRFVPGKDKFGERIDPKLDILVQVGMCSEGSDTVNVVEIVDLGLSTFMEPANSDRQFIGRGARVIRDGNGDPVDVACTVWVPSDCPIAELHGIDPFHQWIDGKAPKEIDGKDVAGPDPIEPVDIDVDVDLVIKSNLITVKRCHLIEWMEEDMFPVFCLEMKSKEGYRNFDLNNPTDIENAKRIYQEIHKIKAEEKDRHDELEANKILLDAQVKRMVSFIVRLMASPYSSTPKTIYQDVIKRVNSKIIKVFGHKRQDVTSSEQVLEILQWLNEQAEIINRTRTPPAWCI